MKKKTKLSIEIKKSRCLYKNAANKSISAIMEKYNKGDFNRYKYISEMYKKYSVFFELQEILHDRGVDSLSINSESVVFKLKNEGVKFAIDKSCRSAIFELLNFGFYERDEMKMIKNLLRKNVVFFDVGSHLGWYSIILAKCCRSTKFYAFEPIQQTYDLLKKNICENKLNNILAFNFGFSDKTRIGKFYYSETGSAVASERNIFDMKNIDTVQCHLKTLDDFVQEEKIKNIDFLKCDVEGAEFLVIQGGKKAIKKFLPILFLELVEDWTNKFGYTISNVIEFLFNIGYKMFEIKNEFIYPIHKIDPDKIDNFNFLFLHNKKHSSYIDKYIFPN